MSTASPLARDGCSCSGRQQQHIYSPVAYKTAPLSACKEQLASIDPFHLADTWLFTSAYMYSLYIHTYSPYSLCILFDNGHPSSIPVSRKVSSAEVALEINQT